MGVVCVLIFVHQHIAELALVVLPHIAALLEQMDGLHDDVIKIHGPGPAHPVLVFFVNTAHGLLVIVVSCLLLILPGGNQFVLGPGNLTDDPPQIELLFIIAQLPQSLAHHFLFVVFIVDGEVAVADPLPIPAENAHTGRMEGMGPDVLSHGTAGFFQPVLQLPGRLVGKGDGDDLPRTGRVYAAQIHNILRRRLFRLGQIGSHAL